MFVFQALFWRTRIDILCAATGIFGGFTSADELSQSGQFGNLGISEKAQAVSFLLYTAQSAPPPSTPDWETSCLAP